MDQLGDLLVFFAALFMASLAASYLIHAAIARAKRPRVEPGAVLRLRCTSGVHRSTLVRASAEGWTVSAPLQRDRHVPIRTGESLLVEGSDSNGTYLFRTNVIDRDAESHSLLLRA